MANERVPDLGPLRALAAGFVDPDAPHLPAPGLRGEGEALLSEWLERHGATDGQLVQAAEDFRKHADRYLGELGLPKVKSDLRTLIFQRGYDDPPVLAVFLQEALLRADDQAQWEGLLRLLGRLAALLAFRRLGPPSAPTAS